MKNTLKRGPAPRITVRRVVEGVADGLIAVGEGMMTRRVGRVVEGAVLGWALVVGVTYASMAYACPWDSGWSRSAAAHLDRPRPALTVYRSIDRPVILVDINNKLMQQ